MYKFPKLPFYASVGAIPESYLISLSYEEQILWLCSQVQAIKEGTPNYNYELLENKPSINNIPLIGNLTPEQLGLSNDYRILSNKPMINSIVIEGNKTLDDYGIQQKLVAGSGIDITGNTISATGGGGGGGTSDYNDLSNKPSLNLVTIEGHLDSRDYGIQPQLQVNVTGELTTGYTYDISNLSVNDVILPYTSNTSEVKYSAIRQVTSNGACKIIEAKNGERYYFRGVVQFVSIGEDNEVKLIWDNQNNTYYDDLEFTATGNRTLLVSFFNISTQVSDPRILQVQMGESIAESHLRNEVSTNEAKYDIEKLLLENAEYKSKTLSTGKYYSFNGSNELIEINQLNTSCLLIDLSQNPIYNRIKIKGKAIDHNMFIYFDEDEKCIKYSPENLAYFDEYIYLDIPEEATYLAINFFDTNTFTPSLEVIEMADTKAEGNFYTIIDEDIALSADGTSSYNFENTKYYFLKYPNKITYTGYNNVSQTEYGFTNSIFYYAETESGESIIDKKLQRTGTNSDPVNTFTYELYWASSLNYWSLDERDNNYFIKNYHSTENCRTRDTIASTGNNNDVPTINAVRNYIASLGSFYTEIDEDITLSADGTSSYNFEDKHYYYMTYPHKITYVGYNSQTHNEYGFQNSLFYYTETETENVITDKKLQRTGTNSDPVQTFQYELSWSSTLNYWELYEKDSKYYVRNYHSTEICNTRDTIPSSGQNNDVPTINAVRNYTANFVNGGTYITNIWKGTQSAYDLIDPKSPTTMYIIE